jgi:hypothetical protein
MTLTVRLPETIESQLTRFCEAMGMSKSQVVQTALKDWFAKPSVNKAHPLLAFVQAASVAAPSADWAGPYSKDRLRERVLASGNRHRVSEPVAAYVVVKSETAARVRVASKKIKSDSELANIEKGLKAKKHQEKPTPTHRVEGP